MKQRHMPYVIGIAGGTASGKTTMAQTIVNRVGSDRAVCIAYDSYYKDFGYLARDERLKVNFDHPEALDTPLLISHLERLLAGHSIDVPIFDFHTCTRLGQVQHVGPSDVIVIEGIMTLVDKELRDKFNCKIFVDLDADERLLRRLQRDLYERGRTVESIMSQYRNTVRPMHDAFVEPSKRYADYVIAGNASQDYVVGDLTAQHKRIPSGMDEELGRVVVERVPAAQQITSVGYRAAVQDLLQIAAKEMKADFVTVHRYDQYCQRFSHTIEYSAIFPPGTNLHDPLIQGVSGYVVAHGYTIVSDLDLTSNNQLAKSIGAEGLNVRALVGVRLIANNEILGVMLFSYLNARIFHPKELALSCVLGMYASSVISSLFRK